MAIARDINKLQAKVMAKYQMPSVSVEGMYQYSHQTQFRVIASDERGRGMTACLRHDNRVFSTSYSCVLAVLSTHMI